MNRTLSLGQPQLSFWSSRHSLDVYHFLRDIIIINRIPLRHRSMTGLNFTLRDRLLLLRREKNLYVRSEDSCYFNDILRRICDAFWWPTILDGQSSSTMWFFLDLISVQFLRGRSVFNFIDKWQNEMAFRSLAPHISSCEKVLQQNQKHFR